MKNRRYLTSERYVQRVGLIVNAAAGKGRGEQLARMAEKRFAQHGIFVETAAGNNAEESYQLAEQFMSSSTIDALVVCGGDGLINIVLQAQANNTIPMGIIPAGNGNDHARELGIPPDIDQAVSIIAQGLCVRTDLGTMTTEAQGTRFFGTIACTGFDSLVTERANNMSWPRGAAAYNLAILREFLNFHSLGATITVDGEVVADGKSTLVAVGNTRTYGGGMKICPQAVIDDGLFDVTILDRINRFKAAWAFPKIFTGDIDRVAEVSQHRGTEVIVDMPTVATYADGDRFDTGPVTFRVEAQAGFFLVPK
jgi:hypothetical protein